MIFFMPLAYAVDDYDDADGSASTAGTGPAASYKPLKPKGIKGIDAEKLNEQLKKKVTESLTLSYEEAVYEAKGVTLDFMNKPIDLFKLTCTDSAGLTKNSDGSITSNAKTDLTFQWTEDIWEKFCADPADFKPGKSGLGQAAKCVLKQVLKQQFDTAIQSLNKFKDLSFCEAFTTFLNDQITQCINIRLDLPRGNFPGFPALSQCMFGRLNLSVGPNGVVFNAAGSPLVDVVSTHGFEYAKVGDNSPTGFGGSEQQLLGDDGASSLLDISKWKTDDQLKSLEAMPTATSACANLDPNLQEAIKGHPSPTNLLIPGIDAVIGQKNVGTGMEERVLAAWKKVFNSSSNQWEAYLGPAGDLTLDGADGKPFTIPGNLWAANSKYNYLASCYGFEIDMESKTCANPLSDSYKQMCAKRKDKDVCCDPDETNCLEAGLIFTDNLCKEGKYDSKTGVCSEWEHLKGQGQICAKTCCNPALNDCLALNVNICDKYIPAKQCLTATPEQLKQLDPAYGNLAVRPGPNMMIDGRACCLTEWCNLCPQDIILAGAGVKTGSNGSYNGVPVFMKESDLANVPPHCKGGDTVPGEVNANLNAGLVPMKDQIFDNTSEACQALNNGMSFDDVVKLYILCPSTETHTGVGIVDGIAKWFHTGIEGCPESTELKLFDVGVVKSGMCVNLASITKYPTPITKIPKVEGADPVGLCSELPLCPASIPADQDPLTLQGRANGVLDALKNKPGLDGVLDQLNGAATGPKSLETILNNKFGKIVTGGSGSATLFNSRTSNTSFVPSRGTYTPSTTSSSSSTPLTTYSQDDPTKGGTVKTCLDSMGFTTTSCP